MTTVGGTGLLNVGSLVRGRREQLIVCLLIPAALMVVQVEGSTHLTTRIIEVLAALSVALVISQFPVQGICLMLAFVPLQEITLSLLYRFGAPVALVRALGGVKETVVTGLVIAAIRRASKAPERGFDRIDKVCLAYLALITSYVFLPKVLPGLLLELPFSITLLGWRADALFVVAFLAARRLGLTTDRLRPLRNTAIAIAAIAGACALIETFASTTWNRFLVSTVQIPKFQAAVFHVHLNSRDILFHGSLGGHDFIRVGSILLSPLGLGAFLLTAFAISLHQWSSEPRNRTAAIAAALSGAGIAATVTRSAILAGLVVALVTVQFGIARLAPGRLRLVLGLIAAAAIFAPFAGSSLIGQRTAESFGDEVSAQKHVSKTRQGFEVMRDKPLGVGLGTGPQQSLKYNLGGAGFIAESSYLQLGDEVGIAALLLFLWMLLELLRGLQRAPPLDSPLPPVALLAAGVGLFVNGLFLEIWRDFYVSLTFWTLAGVSLGAAGYRTAPAHHRRVNP